jgi:hypothetical protein
MKMRTERVGNNTGWNRSAETNTYFSATFCQPYTLVGIISNRTHAPAFRGRRLTTSAMEPPL